MMLLLTTWMGSLGAGCTHAGPPSLTVQGANSATSWWARMNAEMVGAWGATTESGRTLAVIYRGTSRGSALVESWAPGTSGETVTVFHPAGSSLQLTHYCGQGNQAVLRAVHLSDHRIAFERVAETNLSADQSVLTELAFDLSEEGVVERTEVYEASDGTREMTVLRFVRVE